MPEISFFLDVTPLSLSIETMGEQTRLIERNTTIPTRKSRLSLTAADNQTGFTISMLYRASVSLQRDNKTFRFTRLDGIPPARRGVPQIKSLHFDIDANGIVNVSAKDLGTGKNNILPLPGSNMSDSDIDKAVKKEAAEYEAQDKKRKKRSMQEMMLILWYSRLRRLWKRLTAFLIDANDKARLRLI